MSKCTIYKYFTGTSDFYKFCKKSQEEKQQQEQQQQQQQDRDARVEKRKRKNFLQRKKNKVSPLWSIAFFFSLGFSLSPHISHNNNSKKPSSKQASKDRLTHGYPTITEKQYQCISIRYHFVCFAIRGTVRVRLCKPRINITCHMPYCHSTGIIIHAHRLSCYIRLVFHKKGSYTVHCTILAYLKVVRILGISHKKCAKLTYGKIMYVS